MTEESHTIRLLTEMRQEIRAGFKDVDKRFKGVDKRFKDVDKQFEEARMEREALRQRMVEGEVRLSTELLEVSGAIDKATALLRQQSAIKLVVRDHERRIRKLENE